MTGFDRRKSRLFESRMQTKLNPFESKPIWISGNFSPQTSLAKKSLSVRSLVRACITKLSIRNSLLESENLEISNQKSYSVGHIKRLCV